MTELSNKAHELIQELIAASVAFGGQVEPDWQTRIDKAQRELREYIAELEAESERFTVHGDIERQDAEERAHLEKLVSSLKARIAGLEAANDALLKDNDMLFRSAVNNQPRKNTVSQTFVYGKESEE